MALSFSTRNEGLNSRAAYLAKVQKQQLSEKESRLLFQFQNNRTSVLNRLSRVSHNNGDLSSSTSRSGSHSSSLSSSSTSSWSTKHTERKGRDKGSLLEPIENRTEIKSNHVKGRFSKSSEAKTTKSYTSKNHPYRNQSLSPSKHISQKEKVNNNRQTTKENIPKNKNYNVSGQKSPKKSIQKKSEVHHPSIKPKISNNTTLKSSPQKKFSPKPGLTQCKICSRSFAEDRIKVHTEICNKTKKKKRKIFDATKARVEGTEAAQFQNQTKAVKTKPRSNWRKKREEFIQNLRAAKEAQKFIAKGGNVRDLPPPPPSDTSDYVQCQYCNRKFAQNVAERHIPKCKNIESNKTSSKKFRK